MVFCCNYSQVASFHWHSPTIWQSLWVTNQEVSSQTSVDIYVHRKIGKIILRDKRHLRVISVIHHLLQSFQQSNRFRKLVLGLLCFLLILAKPAFPLSLSSAAQGVFMVKIVHTSIHHGWLMVKASREKCPQWPLIRHVTQLP